MSAEGVPLYFTTEAYVDWWARGANYPTGDEIRYAVGSVGRDRGPELLVELFWEDLLTPEAAAATVGGVWNGAEYPDQCLDRLWWLVLFDLAGYTRNGKPAERPDRQLRLYRGSVPERRGDWSWTDDLTVARGYADGTRAQRPTGAVWTALVEPFRLLARNDGPDSRDESEYVVDTDGLAIERLDEGRPA